MDQKYLVKADQMRSHIDQCKSSGMTVGQYCTTHNLKKANYYYWHKKLQEAVGSGGFIQVTAELKGRDVELIFPSGVVVRFDHLVPVAYLKELVCYI